MTDPVARRMDDGEPRTAWLWSIDGRNVAIYVRYKRHFNARLLVDTACDARYDSCDVGTFPNQTYKDDSGPAAALHSDKSRSANNFELSWLSGQRVSCVFRL